MIKDKKYQRCYKRKNAFITNNRHRRASLVVKATDCELKAMCEFEYYEIHFSNLLFIFLIYFNIDVQNEKNSVT